MAARFVTHAEAVERALLFFDSAESDTAAQLVTQTQGRLLVVELRRLRAEKERMDRDRAYYADQLTAVTTGLEPLCPCAPGHPNNDGPQRECPIHGDGETFVAYVQALEALLRAGRGWSSRVTVIRRTPTAAMSTEAIELLRAVDAVDALDGAS